MGGLEPSQDLRIAGSSPGWNALVLLGSLRYFQNSTGWFFLRGNGAGTEHFQMCICH
jgi:hypothetical protein